MSSIVIYIFLLSIGASFIQRTTGFGFGIFIMTMLPFLMPSYGEATTLSGLLAITTSAAIVWRLRSYNTPANDRNAVELTMMSDVVIEYEKEHYPIAKPTVAQLIQLSLDEKNMSQKQLADEIGVSPSRISDYISGRAEPTLKIARLLCATLGITPAAMLDC